MKTNVLSVKMLMFSVLSLLLATSCSPDDGKDGAVGPQGEQGEQGPIGPQGEQGEQGETGTANVIYSDWIARNFIGAGALQENTQGLEVFSESELDPFVDVVLVYGRRSGEGDSYEIYQLPYLLSSQNEYYFFGLYDVTGGIGLQARARTTDGGSNLFTFFDDFRYIIIPGGVAVSGKSAHTVDYTKMTYEEIIAHFNIPQ